MRPIPGFDDYMIDEQGAVLSSRGRRKTPRLMRGKVDADGYPRVSLVPAGGGQARWHFRHRLVLLTFRGPCPPGMESRHLDGEPSNCSLDNLEWSTHQENLLDKRRHGTDPNAVKTHCAQGHPYNKKNTYYRVDRPGSRTCRVCNRVAKAKARAV